MIADKAIPQEEAAGSVFRDKMRDYSQLVKFRLNITVVLSTFVGFLLARQSPGASIDWYGLFIVVFGGFLTVGAANGINQIIEKDSDKLMRRTENRPLASNRMGVLEATLACLAMGCAGVFLIGYNLNVYAAALSALSLVLYGFVYTPLKKISPIAVYVGAIPGALPTIIGYVAASNGEMGPLAWTLFLIQLIWQFPHFYSIAWLLDEDYKRAGLKLLPLGSHTKGKSVSIQILLFALLLVPVSFMPWWLGVGDWYFAIPMALCSAGFAYQSLVLNRELTNKAAKRLMFYSIMYLPVIFLFLLLDNVL